MVLRVGIADEGLTSGVLGRLLELGGVPADLGTRQQPIDEAAIVIVDLSQPGAADPSPVHLLLRVGGSTVVATQPPRTPEHDADVLVDAGLRGSLLIDAVDELWHNRLVPFEANLRMGKRAPRRRHPVLADPQPAWRDEADRLISRLQATVGVIALRIDHIGSTSVPGPPAKDLIDIQVTVPDLDAARAAAARAHEAGFVHVAGQWFGEDRLGVAHPEQVAVDADPGRPTNVNFRPVSGPVWREALLFRDWLRANDEERDAYAAMKQRLGARTDAHVDTYSKDKMPWIRAGLARAERWADDVAWKPA